MRTSTTIATFLVVGAGVAGIAALPVPYFGSDTLFNVTTQAIAAVAAATPTFVGPVTAYVGGGSGGGDNAMAPSPSPFAVGQAKQQTAPMSRMIKKEGNECSFNGGTNGTGLTNAAGIVIGLDAVDVYSSITAGTAAACQGPLMCSDGSGACVGINTACGTGGTCTPDVVTNDNSGFGLNYNVAPTGVFAGSTAGQTWKWALAMVYGGADLSPGGKVDCNQAGRATLVNNWKQLFENGCSNGNAACAAAPISGQLWHAFRRDDTSGTSDVFATILGLSPSTSNSGNHGFGASPYCNALNWDSSTGNANCANGPNLQFTGPGGILVPTAAPFNGDGVHRKPPTGVWGDTPVSGVPGASGSATWDVLPTQMQDNDPIRRPCLGGSTGNPNRAGEEVCNIDGALGLVLPMVDSDFVPNDVPSLGQQYPTNTCTNFTAGAPVNVFACSQRGNGTFRSGECPNGDSLNAGQCLFPIDTTNTKVTGGTAQCLSTKATVATVQERSLGSPDGRAYNIQLLNISPTAPLSYVPYTISSLGTTVNFAGAYNRIHVTETVTPGAAQACQLQDMTDQIACLAQADPCSIGYGGDGGKLFSTHSNPAPGTIVNASDSARVAQVYPNTASVQNLGLKGEYQLARKLYFNTLIGFNDIAATANDPSAVTDELALAKFEANPAAPPAVGIRQILLTNDFFQLGTQSPAGLNTPFCEDFDEQTNCNAGAAPANVNACNSATLFCTDGSGACAAGSAVGATCGTSGTCQTNESILGIVAGGDTVCGDGVRGAYEECDLGTANGGSGAGACSLTCRCVLDFNNTTGACN